MWSGNSNGMPYFAFRACTLYSSHLPSSGSNVQSISYPVIWCVSESMTIRTSRPWSLAQLRFTSALSSSASIVMCSWFASAVSIWAGVAKYRMLMSMFKGDENPLRQLVLFQMASDDTDLHCPRRSLQYSLLMPNMR